MSPDPAAGSGERLSGIARVAFAGIVWGTIPLALRAADGATIVKVFYRVVFAALVIGAWMLATGRWRELATLGKKRWLQLVLQGLLLTLNWALFLTALDMTSVATAELLGYTGPVFVAALTPLLNHERFDRRIIAPLLLSLGGISVILGQHGLTLGTPRQTLGALLAAASALTYAGLLLSSKRLIHGISSSALMVAEYLVASVVLLPFVIAAYANGAGPQGVRSYVALAVLGGIHTALTGLIFFSGLRMVRADHAGILMYAEPTSAVLFAALFLGEALTLPTIAGGILVVLGGVLVARMVPAPSIEAPAPMIDADSI